MKLSINVGLCSLALFALLSCNKKDTMPDLFVSPLSAEFYPRSSDYIYADCVNKKDRLVNGETWHTISLDQCRVDHCKTAELLIFLEVTSIPPEARKYENYFNEDYISAHDEYMEEQLSRYFTGQYFGFRIVEYRTETCLDLRVTCSESLFGRPPGSDLTEYFEFYTQYRPHFMFNKNKRLIGSLEGGLTIKEYLDLSPMVFDTAMLHFRQVPPEVTPEFSPTVTFIVTAVLEGGKTLSNSTTVTLEK